MPRTAEILSVTEEYTINKFFNNRLHKKPNRPRKSISKNIKGIFSKHVNRVVKKTIPQLNGRRHYASFITEHKRTAISLMPQKRLTRNAGILSVLILVLSSINPVGGFFDSGYYNNDAYLSEQDIAFNLEQLAMNEEGYITKSVPQSEDSVTADRIETVDHTVQDGESITQIANLYELKVDTITAENNIVSVTDITPGQVLKIPPVDGVSHTIERNENLSSIAAKYEVNAVEIQKFNNLENRYLSVGEKIFIPGGKRITASVIAQADPQPSQANGEAQGNNLVASVPADSEPVDNYTPIDQLDSTTNVVTDPDPVPTVDAVETTADPYVDAPAEVAAAPVSEGFWGMPTNGQVTQGYRSGHYALDIANSSKPPIWAAADGIIVTSSGGYNGGYGNHVIVDHGNGYKTLYAHMEELYVTTGQSVTKGDVIGKMGATGRVYGRTGIHVHYECHHNGAKINPYTCMP